MGAGLGLWCGSRPQNMWGLDSRLGPGKGLTPINVSGSLCTDPDPHSESPELQHLGGTSDLLAWLEPAPSPDAAAHGSPLWRQRQHWGLQPGRTRLSGWPCRGKRIGEALRRLEAPIKGCASGDAAMARGWASHAAMRPRSAVPRRMFCLRAVGLQALQWHPYTLPPCRQPQSKLGWGEPCAGPNFADIFAAKLPVEACPQSH